LGFVISGFSNKYCDWVGCRWEQFFDFAAFSSTRDPQHTRNLDEFVTDFHPDNTKSVRRSFERKVVAERAVLGSCAVCVGSGLPQFRRNLTPSSSSYEDYDTIHGLINLKKQAVRSFETSKVNYPTARCKTQKSCFFITKTDL